MVKVVSLRPEGIVEFVYETRDHDGPKNVDSKQKSSKRESENCFVKESITDEDLGEIFFESDEV